MQHNLKQMGLALHNYHDSFQSFPFGSRSGSINPRNKSGTNWRASILGFLEQKTVFDQLNFETGSFGAAATKTGYFSGGNEVLINLLLPVYKCPSSTIDPFVNEPTSENDGGSLMHDYVGIAGAHSDPANRDGVCKKSSRGWVCRSGLLLANEVRKMRDALDGTSNSIIVAEQSGLVNGIPIRPNYVGGWTGTSADTGQPIYTVATMPENTNFYHTGLTVVHYAINSQTTSVGSRNTYETNTILNSFHPGAVLILLADGSVRGLSETIEMATLGRLCAADDGFPVGEY